MSEVMPRRALWWLIGGHFCVVFPHLSRVPWWVLAVYAGASVWRLQMHRERTTMPSRGLRLLLALGGMAAISISYRTLIGLEPMVALLLVASGLKLIESVRVKDGYVLVCLAFFVVTTQFLFDQSLPTAIYCLLGTVILINCLVALNQLPLRKLSLQGPSLVVKMLGLAVPMMVVLFVLFPRIGPLWSVPSKSSEGVMGMSDHLSPGDVTRLGRSADVAFRVQFDGPVPENKHLYWRGMVLNRFDGEAWRTLDWREHPAAEQQLQRPASLGRPMNYRVILEPTLQNWLYALPYAQSNNANVVEAWDFRLVAKTPIEGPFSYRVSSYVAPVIEPVLSPWRRTVELELPRSLNPRTRAWVDAQRAVFPDDAAFIANVLSSFSEQAFYYTLEPTPIADRDFVDRFYFDTRRGFCEHYAYAFVVMMRMAGIPARIIGGYQGGERNPFNNTLIVRQFDAHAWAEVWLPGQGWQRVDPTAAVAPDRIIYGSTQALGTSNGFLADSPLSAYRFKGLGWVNWLRLQYDAAAWRWQSFVVGFDSDEQMSVLSHWFGRIDVTYFVTLLLGSWAAVLLPLTWWLHRSRKVSDRTAIEQSFEAMCKRLERRLNLTRGRGESAHVFRQRVAAQLPSTDPLLRQLDQIIDRLYRVPN